MVSVLLQQIVGKVLLSQLVRVPKKIVALFIRVAEIKAATGPFRHMYMANALKGRFKMELRLLQSVVRPFGKMDIVRCGIKRSQLGSADSKCMASGLLGCS